MSSEGLQQGYQRERLGEGHSSGNLGTRENAPPFFPPHMSTQCGCYVNETRIN